MVKTFFKLLIVFYQNCISPYLGPRCRFYPSCSSYMLESIEKHGVIKGLGKGVWRIIRCNPFNPGGYDPVI